MGKPKNNPPSEIINELEYFYDANGDLYRARADKPKENRAIEFVAPPRMAEFVLGCARIKAGLSEWGNEGTPPVRPARKRRH